MEIKNSHKSSILIVDDEIDIREILQFNLENEGYVIDSVKSAEEALDVLRPDHKLILLDIMMSEMSGLKLADKLRKRGDAIPIIFLTAKSTENDMLTGFSLGADDYISKPFSIKEVIARVRSVLRRSDIAKINQDSKIDVIKIENLEINLKSKVVSIGEKILDLTKTEFNILLLFANNLGTTYTRSDILDKVWPNDGVVLDRTVDVHIARLRKKLREYGENITNRTGYGYSFNIK